MESQKDTQSQQTVACDQSLQFLVNGSTLTSLFKKEIKAEIEKEEGQELTIKLTVPATGTPNSTNTVGWLVINTAKKTMSDITNDPENPVGLKYKSADWDRFISCRTL